MSRQRILLVEDDPQIRNLLAEQVEMLGFDLVSASDGESGMKLALAEHFALMLLDVNLPRIGGIEICRTVKAAKPAMPIIIVSARGEELDKVLGLQLGADDYVVKPFSVAELVARIQARLRSVTVATKSLKPADGTIASFEGITIDLSKRTIVKDGVDAGLTALEFDLLALLVSHQGVAFSRAELLQKLWGVESEVYESSPTPVVTRLRKKVEADPAKPRLILTVWSVGYKFSDEIAISWRP